MPDPPRQPVEECICSDDNRMTVVCCPIHGQITTDKERPFTLEEFREVDPDPPAEHRGGEDDRLRETATRIETAAQAMFEYETPDGSWEAEKRMLSGPKAHCSAAPRYRHLAETALASDRSLAAQVTTERDEAAHEAKFWQGQASAAKAHAERVVARVEDERRPEPPPLTDRDGMWERAVQQAEARAETAERKQAELREALDELHAYLRLKGADDHRRHGEACGADACILCLCVAVIENALTDPKEQPNA